VALVPGTLLRVATAPSIASVTGSTLGFPGGRADVRAELDRIPRAVVAGYEWAHESRSVEDLAQRLDLLGEDVRGFGYEGATMAWTITDAVTRKHRVSQLLNGPGAGHLFLSYIGIGFAMAKLPRRLWRNVLPDISAPPYHPTLSWLAVDGYGFDLAYFAPNRWLATDRRPADYPWLGVGGYLPRAVDQGFGRALWFVHAGDPDALAAAVDTFAAGRHADLWAGVGLAAAVAGPYRDGTQYRRLQEVAGRHAGHLGQGAVFAARARCAAGFVPAHTRAACTVLTGLDCEQAAELGDRVAVTADAAGVPAYERWRAAIRVALALG